MKNALRSSILFAMLSLLLSCNDTSSPTAPPSGAAAAKGPGIMGTWTLDTTLTIAGLVNDINGTFVVTSDSVAIDTLERYNNDGSDVEDLFWYTKRSWTTAGNDVIFTKTTCRRTDFLGGWATINCLTPLKDTVIGGMAPGLSSFTIRTRESNVGIAVYHKAK